MSVRWQSNYTCMYVRLKTSTLLKVNMKEWILSPSKRFDNLPSYFEFHQQCLYLPYRESWSKCSRFRLFTPFKSGYILPHACHKAISIIPVLLQNNCVEYLLLHDSGGLSNYCANTPTGTAFFNFSSIFVISQRDACNIDLIERHNCSK